MYLKCTNDYAQSWMLTNKTFNVYMRKYECTEFIVWNNSGGHVCRVLAVFNMKYPFYYCRQRVLILSLLQINPLAPIGRHAVPVKGLTLSNIQEQFYTKLKQTTVTRELVSRLKAQWFKSQP